MGAFRMTPGSDRATRTLEKLETAAAADPDAADLRDLAFARWFLKNDTDGAERAFRRSLDKEPSAEAHMGMGLTAYFQGRVDEAQGHFLETFRLEPGGDFAALAVGFLAEFRNQTADFPTAVGPVLGQFVDDPRLDAESRLAITECLADLDREAGDLQAEKRMRRRLGEMRRFLAYGPFGAVPLLDFDRAFGPESAARPETAYPSESDPTEIKGIFLDRDATDVSIRDLYKRGGVFYLVTYIHLDASRTARFRLAGRRTARLFIDGRPMLTVDDRAALPENVNAVLVSLDKGWHKIALKLARTGRPSEPSLRILAEDGGPLEHGDDFDPENPPAVREGAAKRRGKPENASTRWFEKAEKHQDLYHGLFALLAALSEGRHERMKILLKNALSQNPDFAPLHVIRSFSVDGDPAIPGSVGREIVRASMSRALELDPRMAFAAFHMVDEDLARDDTASAIRRLKTLSESAPGYYLWPRTAFEIHRSNGWFKEADANAARALALNGRDLAFLRDYRNYQEERGRYEDARRTAERIDLLDGAGTTLAARYEAMDALEDAAILYRKSLEQTPEKTFIRRALAGLAERTGNRKEAVRLYEELRALPGNETRFARHLADLYQLEGDTGRAISLLRENLDKEPDRFNLRASLALHEGRELLSEFATDGDKLIAEFKAAPWKPEAGAVIVLDEYVTRLLPGGSVVSRTHIIVRVQTKEAQSRYGEIHLPSGAEVYRVRVLKADGRELVPEQITGKTSVTLPDVGVGDFIEYDYVEGGKAVNWLPDGRAFNARFLFQSMESPTFRSRFVVEHPENMDVTFFPLNYRLAPPRKETRDGRTVVRYANEKLDQIVREPFMPIPDEVLPIVDLSRSFSWTEFRDLMRQSLSGKRRPTVELRRYLEDALSSLPSDSPVVRRVEHLFYRLANDVEGSRQSASFSDSATRILLKREGNRLLVLSALLDLMGLENTFLMAKPINYREIPYPNANFKVYPYVLLRVLLPDGQTLYLDGDYKESVFNHPTPMLSGSRALVLDGGPELFTDLPAWTGIGQAKELTLHLRLQADGSADAEAIERVDGHASVSLRQQLKKLPKDQIRLFFEMVLNKSFPGTGVKEVRVLNLEDPSKPLELQYDFHSSRLARRAGEQLRVERAFFPVEFLRSYIQTAGREFPFLINGINSGTNTIILEWPENLQLDASPISQSILSPFGHYHLNVEKSSGKLLMERDFRIPIQRIAPAKYLDFYKFCSKVDQLERERLIFSERSPAAGPAIRP